MIRNLTAIRFRPGTTGEQMDAIVTALRAVTYRGCSAYSVGRDLGLRPGNADIGVLADFEDEQAYGEYDADPEHNRIRRELIAPIAESVTRIQFGA